MTKLYLHLLKSGLGLTIIMIVSFMIFNSCKNESSNHGEQAKNDKEVVVLYAHAINSKDSITINEYTADTLTLIYQDWNNTDDEIYLSEEIKKYEFHNGRIGEAINKILNEVSLENDSTYNTIDSSSQYSEIKDCLPLVNGYAFLRYNGDVEHILILNLNKQKKVSQIYLN